MAKKKKKRRAKRKLSILQLSTVASIPFVPAEDGWNSPLNDAKAGNWAGVAQNLIHGFQPFVKAHLDTGEVKMDLHLPRYLMLVLAGTVASKVAGKFGANRLFNSLPGPFNRIKW